MLARRLPGRASRRFHPDLLASGLDQRGHRQVIMNANWVSFAKVVQGRPTQVRADVAAPRNKDYAKYGWVLSAGVLLRRPSADGLSMPEETPALLTIEAAIIGAATPETEAAHVGTILSGGRLDVLFQASDVVAILREVDLALAAHPDQPAELRCWHDPRWEHYLKHLYPTASDWLYISARSEATKSLFGREGMKVQQEKGK
jgi:hypothetical protein